MKAIAITHKGFEDICSLEVKELIAKKSSSNDSVVIFDASEKDLCKFCYWSQSSIKVLSFIDDFIFKDFDEIVGKGKIVDLSSWLKKGKTFAVNSTRIGAHAFSSQDVEMQLGEAIYEKYKNKVDLDHPDVIVFVYIYENHCYIGIDYSGIDLSKRQHKIFMHPKALKGTIGYCLVRLSGYSSKKTFLDPFCGSGTIPIEAALFGNSYPVNFFNKDKFAFLKFTDFDFASEDKKILTGKLKVLAFDNNLSSVKSLKSNSKVAGVDEMIDVARADIEWLDTKVTKESIDCIATNPPSVSKIDKEERVKKVLKELFYQAEFILKKDAKICIMSKDVDLLKAEAERYKFKVEHERVVMAGKEEFPVIVFVKDDIIKSKVL